MVLVVRGPNAPDDEPFVRALVENFGGEGTAEFIEPQNFYTDTVVIGGQMASPTYDRLVRLGYVPALEYSSVNFGAIFYAKINNHNVWVIAGRATAGTGYATNWAIQNGLPFEDVIVPANNRGLAIKVQLDNRLLGNLLDWASRNLSFVRNKIQSEISKQGVAVDLVDQWFDRDTGTIYYMFNARGETSISFEPLTATVIIIVSAVALALGVIAYRIVAMEHHKFLEWKKLLVDQLEKCDDTSFTVEQKLSCRSAVLGSIGQPPTTFGKGIGDIFKGALPVVLGVGGVLVVYALVSRR